MPRSSPLACSRAGATSAASASARRALLRRALFGGMVALLGPVIPAQDALAQSFSVTLTSDNFGNGAVHNPGGPSGNVAIGTTEVFHYVSGSPTHFIEFDVVARNLDGRNFDLTLTNLTFQTDVPTPGGGTTPLGENVRIVIVADFQSLSFLALPTHNVTGTAVVPPGYSANFETCSHHGLPWPIGWSILCDGDFVPPGGTIFSTAASHPAAIWPGSLPDYRIETEYYFAIIDPANGTAFASMSLPNSGHDSVVPICDDFCKVDPFCCFLVEWDQACTDAAVAFCGTFIHDCGEPSTLPNDCATSPEGLVDGIEAAFNTTSAQTDGPSDGGCPAGKDLWYVFQFAPGGNGELHVDVESSFDATVSLYALGPHPSVPPSLLPALRIGCVDAQGAGFEHLVYGDAVEGDYYLIQVAGADSGSGPESGTGSVVARAFAVDPDLIARESFDYEPAPGALELFVPAGLGWADGWSGANSWTVQPGTLAYSDLDGRELLTSGNRLVDSAGDQVRSISFDGGDALGGQTESIWFSVIAHRTSSGGTAGSWLGLQLPCSGPNAFLFFGKPFGKDAWGIDAATGPAGHKVSTVPTSTQAFLVMRVDFKPGLDDVYMWVNPQLDGEPQIANADVQAPAYGNFQGIDKVRAQIGGSASIVGALDEIRVGRTFASVAPQAPVAPTPGDLNGDGVVDGADLGIMLGNWGSAGAGDLDGNGVVDGADLGALLGLWGTGG